MLSLFIINFSQMEETMKITLFWISALIAVSSGQDPCTDAVNIGNPVRSVNYRLPNDDSPISDHALNPNVWYNLESHSGSQLPETCVPDLRCGTEIPVWLNGHHPNETHPGPVDLQVCATEYGDCCSWSATIGVKRCEKEDGTEFFVYKLFPTRTRSAYCAGDGIACRGGFTWNIVTEECQLNPTMTIPPTLGTPYISDWKLVEGANVTKFSIDCNIIHTPVVIDDGIRFKVRFQSDGQTIATFGTNSTNPMVIMGEEFLKGYIGKMLVCSVSTFIQSYYPDPDESAPLQSNGFLFDLWPIDDNGNIINSRIRLQIGERFRVRLKSTFPITFEHCFHLNEGIECHQSYTFYYTANATASSSCGLSLGPGNGISKDIIITSAVTPLGPIDSSGTVSFEQNDSPRQIFYTFKIRDILFTHVDTRKKPQCTVLTDPHITTFTGRQFDIQVTGDFYLLKHNEGQFEVQARFVDCSRAFPGAKCACGVVVRDRNNILGISYCDTRTSPIPIQYLLDESTSGGRIVLGGNTHKIEMPNALTVRVEPYFRRFGGGIEWLNIYVVGMNYLIYEGICANTTTSSNWNQYRVPRNESFFALSGTNPPRCKQIIEQVTDCQCKKPTGIWNVSEINCVHVDSSPVLRTGFSCAGNTSRKYEEVGSEDFISLDFINSKIDHTMDSTVETVNRNWPTPSGITQAQANSRCDNYFRSSPSYSICAPYSDLAGLIRSCTLDIQFTDNLNAVDSYESVLENNCINSIESSIPTTDNPPDPGTEDLLDKLERVESIVCPSPCQNGGTCVNSTCICLPGYLGSDCSLTPGQPPTIYELISDICDIRENPCRTIYVSALHILDSDSLTCKFESNVTGIHYSPGQNAFGNMVYCTLPSNPVSLPDSETAVTFYSLEVSISNDQVTYSNSKTFTVFDSVCVTCETDGTNCQQKPSTCDIKGRCFVDGEACLYDANKVCDSSKCVTKFSTQLSTSCDDGYDICVRCTDQDNRNGFRCNTFHPCTADNIARWCYLFPYTDPYSYIRCDGVNRCNEVPCEPGYIWSKLDSQCIPGDLPKKSRK
jgi:hypothetical protein